MNGKLCEELAVVGAIDPQVLAETALYTDYIDMQKFEQALGVLMLGNVIDKDFDFDVYAYTDTSAGNPKEVKAATQLAAHAANNDNDQIVINVTRQEVSDKNDATTLAAGGLRYVRFRAVSEAGQTGVAAVLALAGRASYDPASANDLASVVEIVD